MISLLGCLDVDKSRVYQWILTNCVPLKMFQKIDVTTMSVYRASSTPSEPFCSRFKPDPLALLIARLLFELFKTAWFVPSFTQSLVLTVTVAVTQVLPSTYQV